MTHPSRSPKAVAGEAPPPPPSTWEGGYMGKKDEEGGIVAILALVREDIIKDRATAKQAEDDAEAKYQKMKTEAEAQVKTLEGEITEMEGSIGSKEADVEAAETDISGKKDELGVVMKRIKESGTYAGSAAIRGGGSSDTVNSGRPLS